MAHYKDVHYDLGKVVPIAFRNQILLDTFDYTPRFVHRLKHTRSLARVTWLPGD